MLQIEILRFETTRDESSSRIFSGVRMLANLNFSRNSNIKTSIITEKLQDKPLDSRENGIPRIYKIQEYM